MYLGNGAKARKGRWTKHRVIREGNIDLMGWWVLVEKTQRHTRKARPTGKGKNFQGSRKTRAHGIVSFFSRGRTFVCFDADSMDVLKPLGTLIPGLGSSFSSNTRAME